MQLAKIGLTRIDSSQFPGKYKAWCYQFTLYQCVMWPPKVCEIPSSVAKGWMASPTLTLESG